MPKAYPASVQGFILTRHWRDSPSGIILELWLSSDKGPIKLTIPAQAAIFFIRESDQSRLQSLLPAFPSVNAQPLALKNFYGEAVVGVYCQQQRQLRQLCQCLDTEGIDYWEADIRPPERFLMERFITSSLLVPFDFPAIQRSRYRDVTTHRLNHIKPVDYRPQLRLASIDIETSMNAQDLYSIAVYTEQQALVFMVADKAMPVMPTEDSDYTIEWCSTPRKCLQAFLGWVDFYDPDILMGWHVVQFDCWVLAGLCERWRVPFTLGRGQQIPHWREDGSREPSSNNAVAGGSRVFDGKRRYLSVPGRVVLDGIELLKTAFYHFESFSLQSVANALLGESKLLAQDDRSDKITDLFFRDKVALARYNLQDCKLVWNIFKKTKLVEFSVERSRLTGLPLDRMGGSVASFDYAYLPRLHRKGYVAPNLGELKSDVVSPGGYVMRSLPGLYRHVLVLDFKSLYPSIIRSFTIDPYAFWYAEHQQLDKSEVVEGFNSAVFSRKEYILPDIITALWQEREKAKADGNQPLSQAIKIIMNSFYGVLGSTGCRFFDPRVCSSITLRGHDIIQKSHQWIEAQGYQVIYGDTDSLFVWLGEEFEQRDGVNQQAQEIGLELAQGLNQWWVDQLNEQLGVHSALEIEFETHYQDFLMPTIRGSDQGSKKRYAGTIWRQAYEHPTKGWQAEALELVFKGLETVRADWTALAKDFQQQLYRKIFEKKSYQQYIQSVVDEVVSGKCDGDLIYRKRLRRAVAAYEKSNPPHVKAAKKYEALSQKTLMKGDQLEYLITINGPEPVDYRQSAIDYQHYIDKQLKPVADSILGFLNDSFERIVQKQIELL